MTTTGLDELSETYELHARASVSRVSANAHTQFGGRILGQSGRYENAERSLGVRGGGVVERRRRTRHDGRKRCVQTATRIPMNDDVTWVETHTRKPNIDTTRRHNTYV